MTEAQPQPIESHRRLVAAQLRDAAARARLGVALRDAGRLSAARREFLEAVRLDPNLAVAWHGLSLVAAELGRGAEAAEALGRRYQLEPSPRAGSDWLYARLHTAEGAETLAEGHGEWGRRWGDQIQNGKLQIQDSRLDEEPPPQPSPGVPGEGAMRGEGLRIGYVSGDFREHAQTRFILPLLRGHDHSRVRVYCYSDVRRPDDVTRRIRSYADVWRETAGLDDLALARRILADQIDVLVELTGHMAGSRLAMFAHRPAKVQAAWPGYPHSTGLPAIDYLIGDEDREPPGVERFYCEKLIRLAGGSQVIDFPEGSPEPGEMLPSERAGHVTFGVSNRLGKVTPEMVRVWARVLGETDRAGRADAVARHSGGDNEGVGGSIARAAAAGEGLSIGVMSFGTGGTHRDVAGTTGGTHRDAAGTTGGTHRVTAGTTGGTHRVTAGTTGGTYRDAAGTTGGTHRVTAGTTGGTHRDAAGTTGGTHRDAAGTTGGTHRDAAGTTGGTHRATGARLRLIVASTEPDDAAAVRGLLADAGIAPHRVELVRRVSGPAYWDFYRDIDICLDTFPYNGRNCLASPPHLRQLAA